ncbi:MAG TPA: hydantoinase B/oxoprolinase family protein [Polyangiales bacterium]
MATTRGSTPTFWSASRGHHADIGSVTPGSMPPFLTCLKEEGAVFRALRIVRDGVLDEATIRSVLLEQRYPAPRVFTRT